jgi:hypothetical protein
MINDMVASPETIKDMVASPETTPARARKTTQTSGVFCTHVPPQHDCVAESQQMELMMDGEKKGEIEPLTEEEPQ